MDNEYLGDTRPIHMLSKEIRHFLEQLWTVVSDSRNRSIVKWTEEGLVFKVIDEKVFYGELCKKFCDGCDKKYFYYFTEKCGFRSIPPLEEHFHHPDFLEHEFARIKNIQPKQALYTPFAYYHYHLGIPNQEGPYQESILQLGDIFKERELEAASVQDTASEFGFSRARIWNRGRIENLDSLGPYNILKETSTLDLDYHSPSEDHSLKSTCSTLVPTPSSDSATSCSTPESLFLTDPSKVIPTKKDYIEELTLNLNDCRLEEQASDSSSSTLTSGSNSPNLPMSASPTTELKVSTESLDIPPSTDNIKDLISDLVSSVSNEECANLNSMSNPRISTPHEVQASDAKKTVNTSFDIDL